jgi:putative transcriptional regulator
MVRSWNDLIKCLAALLLGISASQATLAGEQTDTRFFLAGRLLVASPSMVDPRFAESVILMVQHSSKGAFGLVVNKPIHEIDLGQIAEGFGFTESVADVNARAHFGGPVEPDQGFIIHSNDYSSDSTISLTDAIAISGDKRAMLDAFTGKGPRHFIFVMGYAGWGAGQLESEIARDDWEIAAADRDVIFDANYATKWLRALKLRLIEL